MRILYSERSLVLGGSQLCSIEFASLMLNHFNEDVIFDVLLDSDLHKECHHYINDLNRIITSPRSMSLTSSCSIILSQFFNLRTLLSYKPQVVLVSDQTLFQWFLPCIFTSIPLVWHAHEFPSSTIKAYVRMFIYLSFCRGVVFISPRVKDNIICRPKLRTPISVVIGNPSFVDQAPLVKSILGTKVIHIGFVGRIEDPVKNFSRTLEICRLLNDRLNIHVELHVFGKCSPERLRRLLYEDQETYHLSISFHGFLPPSRIYDQIDLLIMSSTTEACPRVVQEASLFSVPAICSRVGGIPDLYDSSCQYLLYDTNEEAVNALCHLLNAENEYQRVQSVQHHFTKIRSNVKTALTSYYRFLNSLCSERSQSL